jgi:periplasmic protein CpxP/Spy
MRNGNSRQKWLLVLAGILLATNIATLYFLWSSQQSDKKAPGPQRRMGQFMVDQMKFDSVQESVYWKLRDSLLVVQKPLMDSLRDAKKNYFDLLNDPGVSDSLLNRRSEEAFRLQRRLDLVTFRHFQQVRLLCKPEQYSKFDTVIKEIVNRMTTFRRPNRADSSAKKQ